MNQHLCATLSRRSCSGCPLELQPGSYNLCPIRKLAHAYPSMRNRYQGHNTFWQQLKSYHMTCSIATLLCERHKMTYITL